MTHPPLLSSIANTHSPCTTSFYSLIPFFIPFYLRCSLPLPALIIGLEMAGLTLAPGLESVNSWKFIRILMVVVAIPSCYSHPIAVPLLTSHTFRHLSLPFRLESPYSTFAFSSKYSTLTSRILVPLLPASRGLLPHSFTILRPPPVTSPHSCISRFVHVQQWMKISIPYVFSWNC